jgi:hypothetical protein
MVVYTVIDRTAAHPDCAAAQGDGARATITAQAGHQGSRT